MRFLQNEEVDKSKWNTFVDNNKYGNIFQTYDMYEVYKKTLNCEAFLLVIENEGRYVAGLVANIVWEPKLKALSTRSIIKGGPLFTSDDSLRMLLQEYETRIVDRVIYTEVRNIFLSRERDIFTITAGYKFEEELNYLINLCVKDKNIIWEKLEKSRRNGITKAQRLGVKIREGTKEDLDMIYSLLQKTYARARMPLVDKTFFAACFDLPGAKFFIAEVENKPVATIFLTRYKSLVYDWYMGNDVSYSKYCANDLLCWHAIEWGWMNHQNTFDFGGAGDPHKSYSVRDFKKKFSGVEVNFGRYKKIHQPLKETMTKIGFQIYRRLK